jgi:uncharacterized protein (DUF2384 family)
MSKSVSIAQVQNISARIADIDATAENVFGDLERAKQWMHQNNLALGGTPISRMDTEEGVAEVRKILSSIAYGGVV